MIANEFVLWQIHCSGGSQHVVCWYCTTWMTFCSLVGRAKSGECEQALSTALSCATLEIPFASHETEGSTLKLVFWALSCMLTIGQHCLSQWRGWVIQHGHHKSMTVATNFLWSMLYHALWVSFHLWDKMRFEISLQISPLRCATMFLSNPTCNQDLVSFSLEPQPIHKMVHVWMWLQMDYGEVVISEPTLT